MKEKFCGIWATFQYLDDFCTSIKELRKKDFKKITTYSPCPRHEIIDALGKPQSRVPFFTLLFGAVGVCTAYTLASWMSLDWVLPVSNKPTISIPPFTIIAFELMVLLGAYGTMIGIVSLAIRETKKYTFPNSKKFKEYSRFTGDRFGLVVRCEKKDFTKIQTILNKNKPEEIHNES